MWDSFKLKELKDWVHYGLGFSPTIFNPSEITNQKGLISLTLKITPIEHVYFSFQRLLNFNEERNIYYQPDYYYSFGYQDYNSDGWGFGYANYENNQVSSSNDPAVGSFKGGTWQVNYKKTFEDISFKGKISYKYDDSEVILGLASTIKLTETIKMTWDYEHYLNDIQERLLVSAKYKPYKKFFVEGGVYFYSKVDKQEEYESDYYYSIGWRDYRPKHFSVVFSNQYKATRFPWREQADIPFSDVELSISYNF